MRAAIYHRYGNSDVLQITAINDPTIKDRQVLVDVHASTVTTADWRFLTSDFPKGMWLPGRLMTGLFRPRNPVLGMEFSGVVHSVGARVSRFAVGDSVFGFASGGAHAALLAINDDAPIAAKPAVLSHAEAASLPFGASTALVFLRDFAKLQSGQRILIIGASGGVGVHAVQIAKQRGAHVTAVTSTANVDLVKGLGADLVIDYRTRNVADVGETFDVVLDTAGITTFDQAKPLLADKGLFLPLEYGIGDLLMAPVRALSPSGKHMKLRVSNDSQTLIEEIAALAESGALKPVIDSRYRLDDIARAYDRVASRHKRGSVVIEVKSVDQHC